jgi:transcriptional regulator with XRE-family HTH domain
MLTTNLRIAEAMREKRIKSAADLARRSKVNPTTMRAYLSGERNPPLSVCEEIGRATGYRGRWLFDGTGPKKAVAPATVPLVGYVGAGAQAHIFADAQGPFDDVEAPEDATEKTVGVEVRGESLGALFDQWLVFYDDVHDPPHDGMLRKLCVCGLADGRILVKLLMRGQLAGHFTLLSNTEPPIYDAIVEWAAIVKSMRPR